MLHELPASLLFYIYFRRGCSGLEQLQFSNIVEYTYLSWLGIVPLKIEILSLPLLKSFSQARSHGVAWGGMGWHGVANATPGQEATRFLPPLQIFLQLKI